MKFKDLLIGQYFVLLTDDNFDLKLKIGVSSYFDFKLKKIESMLTNLPIKVLRVQHRLMEG